MSDFLSHLVAKSLDATEVLRPRSPSLFEPTKESGGLLSNEPLQSEQAAELFVPEPTVPDRLQDIETLEPGVRRPETRAPVMDDRSELRHQPPQQVAPARAGTSHVAWVQHSGTEDPRIPPDSIQATAGSLGANVPHLHPGSALERTARPFDPTRDSLTPGDQSLPGSLGPISQMTAEQPSKKSAPQLPLRPRISRPAESEQDHAAIPRTVGKPPRQDAPAPAKFTVAERAAPIEKQDPFAVTGAQEATPRLGAAAPPAQGQAAVQRRVVQEPGPPSSTPVQRAPVPASPVSNPAIAVARPHVTRYTEGRMPFPEDHPRGTPATRPTPTIQVTIGRIEVRATPPPAQHAKKPNSAPPVMTLDDYLRQRSKEQVR